MLRWRKPMLGLVPGAAAFATNLLNYPLDQNGYTLSILVLTLALLLWTNYTASIASANRAHVKLTGDARWDFWESGLVAMAALIVLGVMLPPLSTVDRTVDIESNLFSNWAQLQQRLSAHAGAVGTGPGGSGTTGLSLDVPLGGPLTRTQDPIFTYTKDTKVGDYASTMYFRWVDVTATVGGEWRYSATPGLRRSIGKNQTASFAENYQGLAFAGVDIKMLRPPTAGPDIVFYPGELYRIDRPTVATQVVLPLSTIGNLYSIDRLSSVSPPTALGNYVVTVEYSSATDAQLKAAGTNYPDWVQQFSTLPATGYRSPDVMSQIHDLALQIVTDAGATNPYDEATAIQRLPARPAALHLHAVWLPAGTRRHRPALVLLVQVSQGLLRVLRDARWATCCARSASRPASSTGSDLAHSTAPPTASWCGPRTPTPGSSRISRAMGGFPSSRRLTSPVATSRSRADRRDSPSASATRTATPAGR